MEYRVVSGSKEKEVGETVSDLLKNGWELYGNLVVTPSQTDGEKSKHYNVYTQALTRKTK